MNNRHSCSFTSPAIHACQRLLILIGFFFGGAFVGFWVVGLLPGAEHMIVQPGMDYTHAHRKFLLITQAVVASSTFIGAPLLYWRFIEQKPVGYFFKWQRHYTYPMILTLGLVFSFMMINTLVIQWNMGLKLPGFLADFERWAQGKENELRKLTALITTFDSTSDFLGVVFVLAFIPAVGEELFFRGLVQNLLHAIAKNIHVGIALSALIFSAIHLQFYGLVPRFLLGVLFGYVYTWTRDLSFPMVAHFFNNVFILLIIFLRQQNFIEQDGNNFTGLSWPIIALFAATSVFLGGTLRRYSKNVCS